MKVRDWEPYWRHFYFWYGKEKESLPSPKWFEFEEEDRRNREPKDRFKKAFDTLYDRGMFGRKP